MSVCDVMGGLVTMTGLVIIYGCGSSLIREFTRCERIRIRGCVIVRSEGV